MMKKRNIDILFYVETEAQLDSVMPLLVHLRDDSEVTFDVVIPSSNSKDTAIDREVYDSCAQAISKRGFKIVRGIDGPVMPKRITDTSYKVLLSAYMHDWHYRNIDVKYRIMFPYASYYLNKPHWTIKQFLNQDYLADALLSHAIGTKPVTDIFTETYIVPSLKLMDYQKKTTRTQKPVLFYAPTYNEIDFTIEFLRNIDDIKKEYTVIMRGHHKVDYVEDNKEVFAELYKAADKVYEVSEYSIVKPFEEADIVVSDNSAVIFDAIYCGIPVTLFSENPNSHHYMGINTAQSDLVSRGDLLWTDDPSKILSNANQTMTSNMQSRQSELRSELFPQTLTNPVGQWMDVLSIYLDDKLPYTYHLSKRYWIEAVDSQRRENKTLHAEIESLNRQVGDRDIVIANEQSPGIKVSARRLAKALSRKIYENPKRRIKHLLRLPYRKMRIKFLNEPIVIYQFVFTEPDSMNFGDELTKDIVERLFHRKVEVHNQIDTRFDMLGVGSLIHFFNDIVDYRTYVWGSGLIDDSVDLVNRNFVFKACRGTYTRAQTAKKYQNIPLGDPGLLCNLIYKNEVNSTSKIGIIPHLRDESSHYLNDIIKKNPDVFKIISAAQPPEQVADEIKSCRLVLSSSLHGLIVSDSFGVPNMHLMLSDNLKSPHHLRGGEYKFRDYYSGVGRKYENFNPRYRDLLDVDEHEFAIKQYKPIQDLPVIQKALIKSFPY